MIEVIGRTEHGSIEAIIDGVACRVPDDASNVHRKMIAEWEAEGNTIPAFNPAPTTIETALAAKLSEIADKRLAVETGGIMFGQIQIPTDRQTAAIITSAYIKAAANSAYVVENWKVTDAVFVTLDAPTIIALGDAVSDHVQATFNRNAALSLAVQALETVEAINAFDVDAEWDAAT